MKKGRAILRKTALVQTGKRYRGGHVQKSHRIKGKQKVERTSSPKGHKGTKEEVFSRRNK